MSREDEEPPAWVSAVFVVGMIVVFSLMAWALPGEAFEGSHCDPLYGEEWNETTETCEQVESFGSYAWGKETAALVGMILLVLGVVGVVLRVCVDQDGGEEE